MGYFITPSARVYHSKSDCPGLRSADPLTIIRLRDPPGGVKLCSFCAGFNSQVLIHKASELQKFKDSTSAGRVPRRCLWRFR